MADLPQSTDPVLEAPGCTLETFTAVLKAAGSPVAPLAKDAWDILVAGGVDPSFALAHFHQESQYGTAGYAVHDKSWGNSIWQPPLTDGWGAFPYSPGNGFTYAAYPDWLSGVRGYVDVVRNYVGLGKDTIEELCAYWIHRTVANAQSYITTVLGMMAKYEVLPGEFAETGDRMIYATERPPSTHRYPLPTGFTLYRGTNGDVLTQKFTLSDGSKSADFWFYGPVNQPWSDPTWEWGLISVLLGGTGRILAYIKAPDKTKVKTVPLA